MTLGLFAAPAPPRRRREQKASPTCACPGAGCRGTWDVVLIGCGAEKAATPTAAADLYTGSLYRAHRRVLEHVGQWPPTWILSALHRAIEPDVVLAPYEHRIGDGESRPCGGPVELWGASVAGRIQARMDAGARTVLVLAGRTYVDPWLACLDREDVELADIDPVLAASPLRSGQLVVDDPLRGLELGERLAFAADIASAKVDKRAPRCWLHSFTSRWMVGLEERRAARTADRAREIAAASAQLDMFGRTAA